MKQLPTVNYKYSILHPILLIQQGLSGRTLKLGKWTNRDGLQYRVGIKRGYELFPKPLVDRLKTERKKAFDIEQRNAIFALKRYQILQKNANFSSRLDSSSSNKVFSLSVVFSQNKDFETQFEQLKELDKKYSDHGPVFDCVVFHDGQVWRVAIDTSESGDLTTVPLLTDYKKELQFSTFSNQDLLNFSVNIFDNGNTVSIVTSAGTHGTHVAGIVGAYYKDQPELNGYFTSFLAIDVQASPLEFNLSVLKSEIHVWEPWRLVLG